MCAACNNRFGPWVSPASLPLVDRREEAMGVFSPEQLCHPLEQCFSKCASQTPLGVPYQIPCLLIQYFHYDS